MEVVGAGPVPDSRTIGEPDTDPTVLAVDVAVGDAVTLGVAVGAMVVTAGPARANVWA